MVRVITQETFNAVVQENINDFEMSPEEALKDAIEQFIAQGVDLNNIIKSVEMAQGKDPLLVCLNKLTDLYSKTADVDLILEELKVFQNECSKDLSRKVFAGKEGAYPILLDILDKYPEEIEICKAVFQSLNALMDGFPDLLDERGIRTMFHFLDTKTEVDCLLLTLDWTRKCCVNHENNRQALFGNEIVSKLKPLLDSGGCDILPNICSVIRTLTYDDDVRVQVSSAHNHARELALELLCPLTALLTKYSTDKNCVSEIVLTLSTLIVRNEFCAKVEEAGGLTFILDALTEFSEDQEICKNCLLLLKGLAGNDDVKVKIMQAGASSLVLMTLEKHMKSVGVSVAALSAITVLALRSPGNCKVLFDQGAAEIILQTMKVHAKNSKVQKNGCWAVRNMVSRNREFCSDFLKLGAEEIMNAVLRQHKVCEPDAKAALRDLGCKVELKEQWKGKGLGNVTH